MRNLTFGTLLLTLVLTFGMTACSTSSTDTTTPAQPKMTNADLESAIRAKLNSDATLKTANLSIDADAEKNTATLSGTVESQAARTKAVELAQATNSRLLVTDKIDVVPKEITRTEYTEENAREARDKAKETGETIGESLDDAWIHTKIVAKLIGNSNTPEHKINVDVVNKVVTLRGTVETATQKAEAEKVAQNTEGVKNVKNLLKVKAV